MTDIVERLRRSVTKGYEPTDEDAIEAANEIERLRAVAQTRTSPPEPAQARISGDGGLGDPLADAGEGTSAAFAQKEPDREQIAALLYVTRHPTATWLKASLDETAMAYKQADAILSLNAPATGQRRKE